MTPEQRNAIIVDYIEGQLTDALICSKHAISPEQLQTIARLGTGTIVNPQPLTRTLKRGMHGAIGVENLASKVLTPDEMAISPLQSAEHIEPSHREAALFLTDAELSFANNVLRGMRPAAAAAASFEIFNEYLANKKAAELLRASHVANYLSLMKGRSLFAPVRNKAYLEAVLWQVIDRSLELKQEYNVLTGQPMEGRCTYNPKMAIGAAALLARLKGWDSPNENDQAQETHRDRLRRLAAQYNEDHNNSPEISDDE